MAKQLPIPIPGNPVKLTMFISGDYATFTESHYYKTDNENLRTVVSAWNDGPGASRKILLPAGYSITEVRASSEGVAGDTSLSNDLKVTGSPPLLADDNAVDDCLKLRLEGTVATQNSIYHKTMYLGGVTELAVAGNTYKPDTAAIFDKQLRQYLVDLCGSVDPKKPGTSNWGFLALDRVIATKVLIKSIRVAAPIAPADSVTTVTTISDHTFQDNDVVRISRVPGASAQFPWNQLWRVGSRVDARNFTLVGGPVIGSNYTDSSGGSVAKMKKAFVSYNLAVIIGAGTRRRGGRTNLRLGRFKRKTTVGY